MPKTPLPSGPPNQSKYPNLLTFFNEMLHEEWFYVSSFIHWEAAIYAHEVPLKKVSELRNLVLKEILEKNKDNFELLHKCISEIDRAIENTIESDDEYGVLFVHHLHVYNIYFTTWQEHRDFLLMVQEKMKEVLSGHKPASLSFPSHRDAPDSSGGKSLPNSFPKESAYPSLDKFFNNLFNNVEWYYYAAYRHRGYPQSPYSASPEKVVELRNLVVDEVLQKYKNDTELLQRCIQEIDKAINSTIESEDEYMTLFLQHLHLRQLELKGWQEHRDFLLLVREKIEDVLSKDTRTK